MSEAFSESPFESGPRSPSPSSVTAGVDARSLAEGGSKSKGPRSGERSEEPFTLGAFCDDQAATEVGIDEGDGRSQPIALQREPEAETVSHSPKLLNPRRAVVVKLRITAEARDELDGLAAASGMCQAYFFSAALLLGARRLGNEFKEVTRE